MPESSPKLALAVGDRVIYPNQGVCRVVAVDLKEVAGQKLVFVTLRREEDNSTVMVPEAKIHTSGVRTLSSKDEIAEVFRFLTADTDKADLDWKQRARTNLDRMTHGGLLSLAEVVKGLQVLSELRPLPPKERELYDSARHLLVVELGASLGVSMCNAEDSIDIALFPPGKERPKRTVEEFRPGDENTDVEGMELPHDLLSMDGDDLSLPDEDGMIVEEAPVERSKSGSGSVKKPRLSDDEETQTMGGSSEDAAPAKRKRGRPPKVKAPGEASVSTSKPRGRPPKASVEVTPTPLGRTTSKSNLKKK